MRMIAMIAALLPGPTLAWDFTPTPICTMREEISDAEVTVTYDPALPEYVISIRLTDAQWPTDPVFGITFVGGPGLTISTDRHKLSDNDRTLTVRDRGFGNVLNGMAQGSQFVAWSGDARLTVPLAGAAEAVALFEACPVAFSS